MIYSLNVLVVLISIPFLSAGQFNPHQRRIEPSSDTVTHKRIINDFTSANFPGGFAKFYSYVSRKLRYPKDAKRLGVEGKVYVSFVVEKDGSIPHDSVRVLKGIFDSCDKEAVRLIRASPDWIPGRSVETN